MIEYIMTKIWSCLLRILDKQHKNLYRHDSALTGIGKRCILKKIKGIYGDDDLWMYFQKNNEGKICEK